MKSGAAYRKGEKVGSMVVLEGDEETARYRLVSDRKVERADFATTYIRMIKNDLKGWRDSLSGKNCYLFLFRYYAAVKVSRY
ncbi:MAG: hypothetical protein ACLRQA_00035 [Anaerovoracaceae bacterium]